MLVVSDTSPLNYLVLIDADHLLPALFERVLTTPGVVEEMSHPGAPEKTRAWAASPPQWLDVRAPTSLHPKLTLGRGEREAISLACELKADVVLIDERKGAQAAASLGLFVTGTLGVLRLADEKNLLRLSDAIDALRQTTFRASDDVYAEVLRRAAIRRSRGYSEGG